MKLFECCEWVDCLWLQALELPYAGDSLSMFVILPEPGVTLAHVENALTANDLLNVADTFRMAPLKVKVL